jgi:hypothetical protein
MVEMRVHDDDALPRAAMLQLQHDQHAITRRVPAATRPVRRRAEPERLAGHKLPHGRAVDDGVELARRATIITADAVGGPVLGFGGRVGVQAVQDVGLLVLQGFLQANDGGGAEGGGEA